MGVVEGNEQFPDVVISSTGSKKLYLRAPPQNSEYEGLITLPDPLSNLIRKNIFNQ